MTVPAFLSNLSTLIPVSIGTRYWRRFDINTRIVILYSWFSLGCDLISYYLGKVLHNNTIITSIFSLGELILLSFYFLRFMRQEKNRVLITILGILFALILLYLSVMHDIMIDHVAAKRGLGFVSFIIVCLNVAAFFYILRTLETPRIELDPHFWFLSGLLMHMSSTVVLCLSTEFVSISDYSLLWYLFKNLMQVIMNILFGIGLFIGIRRKV